MSVDFLKSLTIGEKFSQSIKLPNYLETLTLNNNRRIILPDSLKLLVIGSNFKKPIKVKKYVKVKCSHYKQSKFVNYVDLKYP